MPTSNFKKSTLEPSYYQQNGIEDLKKAQVYLNRLIEFENSELLEGCKHENTKI